MTPSEPPAPPPTAYDTFWSAVENHAPEPGSSPPPAGPDEAYAAFHDAAE